jgi:hypothetical protein
MELISQLPRRTFFLGLAFVTGFALSLFLIGRLVFSGFSILDDHQIIEWIGLQDYLSFGHIWSTLMSSPLMSSSPRFQPILYLLIAIEAASFGKTPIGYHLIQVLWFAIFLWAVAWACFRSVGIIVGIVLLFLTVQFEFWNNVFTNSLWASEQHAAMGFGLAIFGIGGGISWFINGYRERMDAAVLLLGSGSLICLGVKENFIFLLVPFLILFVLAVAERRIGVVALSSASVILLLDLAIFGEIIRRNLGRSMDIYGHDNSILHRLDILVQSTLMPMAAFSIALGFLIIGIARGFCTKHDFRKLACAGALSVFSGIYLAWEIFFYVGQLPSNGRYDFPSALCRVIILAVLSYVVVVLLHSRFAGKPLRFFLTFEVLGATIILAGSAAVGGWRSYLPLREASARSYARSAAMREDLKASGMMAAQNPNWPIIIVPAYPRDYEVTYTISVWLHDIRNTKTLFVAVAPEEIASTFDQWLVDAMRSWSLNGVRGRFAPRTPQIDRAAANGECFEIAFAKPVTNCVLLPYRPRAYLP